MTGEPISALALWGAKLAGAAAGSAVSVAYLLPRGRREAGVRFMIGIVTGIVFGAPAGLALADRLGFGTALSPVELAMMGSAAASLCAWWALGVLSRFAARLFRDPDKEGASRNDRAEVPEIGGAQTASDDIPRTKDARR